MEIRDNETFYIITPLSNKLDKRESVRIIKEIMSETRTVGLDLRFVYDCTIDFIEGIKDICQTKHVGMFNINSDIFAVFNFMKLDKSADLFVSEYDFENNFHQLINRNFTIV